MMILIMIKFDKLIAYGWLLAFLWVKEEVGGFFWIISIIFKAWPNEQSENNWLKNSDEDVCLDGLYSTSFFISILWF